MSNHTKVFTAHGHTDIICTQGRAVIGEVEAITYHQNEHGGTAGEVIFNNVNFEYDDKFNITIVRNHKNEMITLKDVELLHEYGSKPGDAVVIGKKYVFIAAEII